MKSIKFRKRVFSLAVAFVMALCCLPAFAAGEDVPYDTGVGEPAAEVPAVRTGRGDLEAVPAKSGETVSLSVAKTVYAPEEEITVAYSGVTQSHRDQSAWISVAEKDAPANSYISYREPETAGSGTVTLNAPFDEGEYELRFYAGGSANEDNLDRGTVIRFRVERPELTKNVSLSVTKTVYAPEEEITVAYSGVTQWLCDHSAWISVAEKDAPSSRYISYREPETAGSGTVTLNAPFDEGEYELRFYDGGSANDTNLVTMFTIPITVVHAELSGSVSLRVSKTVYAPEEPITVSYAGMTQWLCDHSAWISVAEKDAPANSYISYREAETAGSGTVTLNAPFDEGEYELRFYDGSSANDLNRVARLTIPFTVLHSELTKTVTLSVPKTDYAPGEELTVSYVGVTHWLCDHGAWISLEEKDAPAGNYISYQMPSVGSGTVTFTAPNEAGIYELRFYDGSGANDLNLAAHLTLYISVGGAKLPERPRVTAPPEEEGTVNPKPDGDGSGSTENETAAIPPLPDTASVTTPVADGVQGSAQDNRLVYETANVFFGSEGGGTAALVRGSGNAEDPGSRAAEIYTVAMKELPKDPVIFAFQLPEPEEEGECYGVLLGIPAMDTDGNENVLWVNLDTEYTDGWVRAAARLDRVDAFLGSCSFSGPQPQLSYKNKEFDLFWDHCFYVTVGSYIMVKDGSGRFELYVAKKEYTQPRDDGRRAHMFSKADAEYLLADLNNLLSWYEETYKIQRTRWPMTIYVEHFGWATTQLAGGVEPNGAFYLPVFTLGGTVLSDDLVNYGSIQINPNVVKAGYRVDPEFNDSDATVYTTLGHELHHFVQRNYYNKLLWVDESAATYFEALLNESVAGRDRQDMALWLDDNYKEEGIVQFELYPAAIDTGDDSNYAHMPLIHFMESKYPGSLERLYKLLGESSAVGFGTSLPLGAGNAVMRNLDWADLIRSAAVGRDSSTVIGDIVRDYYRELVTKGSLYALKNTPWEIYEYVKHFDAAAFRQNTKDHWDWGQVGETSKLNDDEAQSGRYSLTPFCAHFVVLDCENILAEIMALEIRLGTPGVTATVYQINGENYNEIIASEIGENEARSIIVGRNDRVLLMLVNERNTNCTASVSFTFSEAGGMRVMEEDALWLGWDDIDFTALPRADVDMHDDVLYIDLPACSVKDSGGNHYTRSALHLEGAITRTGEIDGHIQYYGRITNSFSYTIEQVGTKGGPLTCTSHTDPDDNDAPWYSLEVYPDGHTQLLIELESWWEYHDSLGKEHSHKGSDGFKISDNGEFR